MLLLYGPIHLPDGYCAIFLPSHLVKPCLSTQGSWFAAEESDACAKLGVQFTQPWGVSSLPCLSGQGEGNLLHEVSENDWCLQKHNNTLAKPELEPVAPLAFLSPPISLLLRDRHATHSCGKKASGGHK